MTVGKPSVETPGITVRRGGECAPVVVIGSVGGVGTSSVSALVAAQRAKSLGDRSVWVDFSPGEDDMMWRLGGDDEVINEPQRGALGGELIRPRDRDLRELLGEGERNGWAVTVDAGTSARSLLPELIDNEAIVPVLVIGVRGDQATRADRAVQFLSRAQILARTIVVFVSTSPHDKHEPIKDAVLQLIPSSIRHAVGFDYDRQIARGLPFAQSGPISELIWDSSESVASVATRPLRGAVN